MHCILKVLNKYKQEGSGLGYKTSCLKNKNNNKYEKNILNKLLLSLFLRC